VILSFLDIMPKSELSASGGFLGVHSEGNMSGGGLQRQAEMRESGFDAPEFAMVCHALAGIAST
jgi:hypothetical protein